MKGRREIRFIVGFLLAIALVIVLFVRIFFSNGGSHNGIVNQPAPLASYAVNPTAEVSMLIDGPVNAESEHNQIQIVVTNIGTTINIFQGYNDQLVSTHYFALSESGFHVFLRSLEYAKFTSGVNDPQLGQASGYCPLGDRYIFAFSVNGQQQWRHWVDNCNGDPQTFTGNLNLTLQLFENQVPNYGNIVSGLNI